MKALFGVSRATVRRAFETLEADGMIERRQGKGTRVVYERPAPVAEPFDQHIHRIEQMAAMTEVAVLDFEWVIPPAVVQRNLGLAGGERVLKIGRVRSAGGRALRYLVNHVPAVPGERIERARFEQATMLAILRDVGRPPTRFEDEVGAILADPMLARTLDVPIGTALVELSRTMFDSQGPIAFQWSVIPPGRGRLRTSIENPD